MVRCQRQLDDVSMNTMIYCIPAVLTREMSFPVLMAWCASTAPVVEKVQQLPHAPYPQKVGGGEEEGKEEGKGRRETRRKGREERKEEKEREAREEKEREGRRRIKNGKGRRGKGEGNGRSMLTFLTSSCNTSCTPNHITHHTTHTAHHIQHTPHHVGTSPNKPQHLVPSSHTAQQMSVNSSTTYVRTYVHT